MKKTFTEINYVIGMLTLALGCSLMERADFGLSMVVAPAYILYRKAAEFLPWMTFGVMEYLFQAVLLLGMCVTIRKFKVSFIFSFITAVIYGYTLNGFMALVALIPDGGLPLRLVFYAVGLVSCSVGVAFMLHTYLSPEVYELIVKEVPRKYGWEIGTFKTVYDCISCAVSILMSFLFFGFGNFVGVKLGTVVCAFVNGFLISKISAFLDKRFTPVNLLPMHRFFE